MTRITRRELLRSAAYTAAATALGALLGGIVEAEEPVEVEDIQAVSLGVRTIVDHDAGEYPGTGTLHVRWDDPGPPTMLVGAWNNAPKHYTLAYERLDVRGRCAIVERCNDGTYTQCAFRNLSPTEHWAVTSVGGFWSIDSWEPDA